MSSLVEVHGACKRFGSQVALDGFDLNVAVGEIVGLVGHNGAGKSTIARAVMGLVALDSGEISVAGHDVPKDVKLSRGRCGLAPQELALYPTATALENLLVFAGLYGVTRREAHRRIDRLATSMALTDVLHRRVKYLSGGLQRRLQAATAMVHRPEVLLLDEPTVGADPVTREALLAEMRRAANKGAAVVYTTHYLPELEALDATIAVADHGRIVARGSRVSLLASLPGHAMLQFDGVPPSVQLPEGVSGIIEVVGDRVTITAVDAAAVLAQILSTQVEPSRYLRTIELQPPTLDDLYRHLVTS